MVPSLDKILLCLALSSSFAEALPKAPWVEQYARTRGRKSFTSSIARRNVTEDPPDCVIQNAQLTQAPKKNIWGSLTGDEASGIVSWLFAQPELNLTESEKAGNWDNTMYVIYSSFSMMSSTNCLSQRNCGAHDA
jgi:primary-amine oxidase